MVRHSSPAPGSESSAAMARTDTAGEGWDGAGVSSGQGLTLVHVRAQLEQLQDTFMG
jgi:hypothetical protein